MQIVWKALLREVTSLNLNKEDEAFALLNGIRSNAGSSQIHSLSRLMNKMFNQIAFQFSPKQRLPSTSGRAQLLARGDPF